MSEPIAHEDEATELARRAQQLNGAIEKKKERIRALQGLPPSGTERGFSLERMLAVEVERALPPLDPARAKEALVDAIHRETGLAGAVSTRGDGLEWKVFDVRLARRALSVTLEGDADAPRLRLKDNAIGADAPGFSAGGFALMMPLVLLTASLRPGPIVTLLVLVGLTALLFVARRWLSRRSGRRKLAGLADALAESLPLRRTGVRVADEEELEEAEETEELEHEEAARGVS